MELETTLAASAAAVAAEEQAAVKEHAQEKARPAFKLGYRPELDGVRGISILLVLGHHLYFPWLAGGFLGVDIFFVLSGFLITSLLAQEWEREGRISLKDFYMRRCLRLMPALLFLLAAFSAYALLFLPREGAREIYRGALLALSYVSNWIFALNPQTEVGTLGITWSLAVEEQFYLFWPLALMLLFRSKVERRWIIYGLILTILGIALHRKLLFEDGAIIRRLYYASDTRADALFIGCLVGLLMSWNLLPKTPRLGLYMKILAALSCLFVGFLVVTASFTDAFFYAQGGYTFVAFAVASALVVLLAWPPKLALTALRLAPLVWVGRVSYGLYLWHWPLRVLIFPAGGVPSLFHIGLTLFLSFALTALSFYLIEKPFLRLKHRFSAA